MKRPLSMFFLLISLLFCYENTFAVQSWCEGTLYIKHGADELSLADFTFRGSGSTEKKAKQDARDRIIECVTEAWNRRDDLLGSSDINLLPSHCRPSSTTLETFNHTNIDLRRRIVKNACALWQRYMFDNHGNSVPILVSVELLTHTGKGCGTGDDLSGWHSFANPYTINSAMCSRGY